MVSALTLVARFEVELDSVRDVSTPLPSFFNQVLLTFDRPTFGVCASSIREREIVLSHTCQRTCVENRCTRMVATLAAWPPYTIAARLALGAL